MLINQYPFSSFWEESDGISYIAFEKCKYVTLDGPKRFEVAKEFNSENFKNLINLTNESHNSALSKIIYLFSFSENLNNKNLRSDIPSLEAILPKILITKSDKKCLLRINGHVEGKINAEIVIIGKNAVIKGDIFFRRTLKTEDGADIDGYIKRVNNGKSNTEEDIAIEEIVERSESEPLPKRVSVATHHKEAV